MREILFRGKRIGKGNRLHLKKGERKWNITQQKNV